MATGVVFVWNEWRKNMPINKKEKMIFALITVIITVPAFVFYSVYVVNGNTLMEATGQSKVWYAIQDMGGIYMFDHMLPIIAVLAIEFVCAYALENLIGSPGSFKLASKVFDMKNTNPVLFETAIICATVCIMCPAMSFLANFFYYPYYEGFNILTFIAKYLRLVCFNFPFALFTQLFFIQPFVRMIFSKFVIKLTRKQHE